MRIGPTTKPEWLALLGAALITFHLAAQPAAPVQRVFMKEGKMLVQQQGAATPLEKEVALPQDIRVMTNAVFRVKQGKERKFQEGQSLEADGMLTSPDGSIVPVFDHVMVKNGRAVAMRDGDSATLQNDVPLGDGSRITPEGYRIAGSGARTKLMDGEMFSMDGQPIPVRDSITLRACKVSVQKDGGRFEVPAGRNLMMNDGSKVFGDGTVVMRDGSTRKLAEGEILAIEGVSRTKPPGAQPRGGY